MQPDYVKKMLFADRCTELYVPFQLHHRHLPDLCVGRERRPGSGSSRDTGHGGFVPDDRARVCMHTVTIFQNFSETRNSISKSKRYLRWLVYRTVA